MRRGTKRRGGCQILKRSRPGADDEFRMSSRQKRRLSALKFVCSDSIVGEAVAASEERCGLLIFSVFLDTILHWVVFLECLITTVKITYFGSMRVNAGVVESQEIALKGRININTHKPSAFYTLQLHFDDFTIFNDRRKYIHRRFN